MMIIGQDVSLLHRVALVALSQFLQKPCQRIVPHGISAGVLDTLRHYGLLSFNERSVRFVIGW
jgi:hypothetical protein